MNHRESNEMGGLLLALLSRGMKAITCWQQVTEERRRNAVYLEDVFIGGLALHEGRDVSDGAVHLYGNHFDGDGHGAPRQDGCVDDLGVLWGGGEGVAGEKRRYS